MAIVDTSVLIYATDSDSRQHAAARELLKRLTEGPDTWHLSWQNVFEFLKSVTDPKRHSKAPVFIDEAIGSMNRLLTNPHLQMINPGPRHFNIFSDIAAHTPGVRGNMVYDARLVAIMLENDVRRIYTADEGFRRFKNIDVVNPFA